MRDKISGRISNVVAVPRDLAVNDPSRLSNDRYQIWSFDSQLVDTGTYLSWPLEHPPRDCLTLLETNALAHSDCPVSRSCGNVVFQKLETSWYGKELGLCTGTIVPHVTIDNGTARTRDGSQSLHWGPLYSFVNAGTATDLYGTLQNMRLLRLPGRDIMFAYKATLNLAGLTGSPYSVVDKPTIFQPYFNKDPQGAFCMWVNPPERARRLVFYDGPTLTAWPTFTPVMSLHLLSSYLPPSCPVYPKRPPMPINGDHQVSFGNGTLGLVTPDQPLLQCAAYKHISAYSVPGSVWIKSMVDFLLESLEHIITSIVRAILSVTYDLVVEFNEKFLLFEISLLAGFAMWYSDSIVRTAVVCAIYAAVFGVSRDPDSPIFD